MMQQFCTKHAPGQANGGLQTRQEKQHNSALGHLSLEGIDFRKLLTYPTLPPMYQHNSVCSAAKSVLHRHYNVLVASVQDAL